MPFVGKPHSVRAALTGIDEGITKVRSPQIRGLKIAWQSRGTGELIADSTVVLPHDIRHRTAARRVENFRLRPCSGLRGGVVLRRWRLTTACA